MAAWVVRFLSTSEQEYQEPVPGELLIRPEFHEFRFLARTPEVRDLVILFIHLIWLISVAGSFGARLEQPKVVSETVSATEATT